MSEQTKKNKPKWLKDMQRVNLLPGDVLVVRPKEYLDRATAHEIENHLNQVFPNNDIIVLLEEMDIGVVSA